MTVYPKFAAGVSDRCAFALRIKEGEAFMVLPPAANDNRGVA